MRKLVIAVLITCLAIPILASQSQASSTPVEMATMEEALIVAENWVELIIKSKGSWGGSETAEVDEIQEFKRGDRVIGYFCRVEPQGFIITSLYKELSPIKAYSATSDLDPECEEGMADVIKAGMDRVLAALELQLGPIESASSEDIQDILEINYLQAWEELQGDLTELKRDLGSGVSKGNYQEGEVLLSSNWNQRPPYNDQCPDMGCYWDDRYLDSSGVTSTNWLSSPFYNENALVGCIAIAGAQTMRHWAWPPYRGNPDDRYDWPNILNEYEWDSSV